MNFKKIRGKIDFDRLNGHKNHDGLIKREYYLGCTKYPAAWISSPTKVNFEESVKDSVAEPVCFLPALAPGIFFAGSGSGSNKK